MVLDKGQKRILAFGNDDEQSCQLLVDPTHLVHEYSRAMMLATLFEPFQHATLLGLGGGSLAHCLWIHSGLKEIAVVELRARVVKVARKFFSFPSNEQIPVTLSDAQEYLQSAPASATDVIFCDVFSADGFDISLINAGFLQDCHNHLSANGWLVVNSWLTQNQLARLVSDLHNHFPDVRQVKTNEGNWVFFAGKRPGPSPGRSLELAAQAMSSQLGFSLLPALRRLVSV